jgi:hypothetical protein
VPLKVEREKINPAITDSNNMQEKSMQGKAG